MSGLQDGRPWEWKGDRLYVHRRLSGYSIVADERYPTMWRVRSPDGKLSDMVNRVRAKDAAMTMLDRNLRYGESQLDNGTDAQTTPELPNDLSPTKTHQHPTLSIQKPHLKQQQC